MFATPEVNLGLEDAPFRPGAACYDFRANCYSLGFVLYACATCQAEPPRKEQLHCGDYPLQRWERMLPALSRARFFEQVAQVNDLVVGAPAEGVTTDDPEGEQLQDHFLWIMSKCWERVDVRPAPDLILQDMEQRLGQQGALQKPHFKVIGENDLPWPEFECQRERQYPTLNNSWKE